MKNSYPSKKIPSDTNKQNRSSNTRPVDNSKKNVIQQLAQQSKTNTHSYQTETRRTSFVQSSKQISPKVIVEESYQPSECTISIEEKSKHYFSVNDEDGEESMRGRRGRVQTVDPYRPSFDSPHKSRKENDLNKVREEVDMMRSKIIAREMQMSNIIQMHQSQVHSLTQKDQNEKNTLIRQIHNNHIQLHKLKNSYQILLSQKENLNIYLREKEEKISELEGELEVVSREKLQIEEEYESVLEAKKTLKLVDAQLEELIEDKKMKMKQLESNKVTIRDQNSEILGLKERIGELNREVKEYQERQSKNVLDLEDEVRRYKEEAIKLGREILRIPDLELKLKESQVSCSEYRSRISQLVENNDRMNVQILSGSGTERKIDDLEWQLGRVRKTLTETEGELSKVRGEFEQKKKEEINAELMREVKELTESVEAQSKQLSDLKMSLQKNQHEKMLRQKQVERFQEENSKLRDRVQVMDQLYKQNRGLTTKLKEKISIVQKLELLINDYEHKLKLGEEETTQRQMETERMLHHNKELAEKYRSIEEMFLQATEEKENMTSRCEGIKSNLESKIEKVKEELDCVKEKSHQQQKSHQEEMRGLESKYSELMIERKQVENSLEQQRQKLINARRKLDGSNQTIIKLNEQAVCKEEIIRTQNNNMIRLGGEITLLKQECARQSLETQKISKWKQLYFTHMNEYSAMQKQVMLAAFTLNQSDE